MKENKYGGLFIFKKKIIIKRDNEMIKKIEVKDLEYLKEKSQLI